MTVGEKVKEVLVWSHIQQKELAYRLNLPYATVHNYISGRSPMPLDVIKQISEVLDVSLFLLLNEEPLPADSTELTKEERALLGRYRLLRRAQREMVDQITELFLAQNNMET